MSIESPDKISATKNPALAAALREMEEQKAQGPWPRRLRIIGTALVIVLIVGGATWAIVARHNANARANEKAAVLASLQNNPRDMRKAIESGQVTREDMQQMWEERENKQMDAYFAISTQADRNKYLDKLIDEEQARQKERQQRASTRPTTRPARSTTQPTTGPTTRPNRFDPNKQRERVQGGDPTRKAQRAAFQAAMRARMAQRGIQPGRGGPGGGGGGGRGGWGGGPGGGGRGR